jgi:hypothetical protein
MSEKTSAVLTRIPVSLKEQMKRTAAKNKRSFNREAERAFEAHVLTRPDAIISKMHGYLQEQVSQRKGSWIVCIQLPSEQKTGACTADHPSVAINSHYHPKLSDQLVELLRPRRVVRKKKAHA